jgi:valyl-tRNA synthetase
VVKVYNATRYVLGQEGEAGPITNALDLGFLHQLQGVVESATASLDAMDYAGALDAIERFFWDSFTDSYLELVKARARSESDPAGRASAVAALRQGLSVLLRLLAPYLPYVTEEAWNWDFAGPEKASVHLAPWPEAKELASLGTSRDHAQVYDLAKGALGAINRAKTLAGGTVGRHVASITIAAPQRILDLFARAEADIVSATRLLSLTRLAGPEAPEFDLGALVKEIVLAPVPDKA